MPFPGIVLVVSVSSYCHAKDYHCDRIDSIRGLELHAGCGESEGGCGKWIVANARDGIEEGGKEIASQETRNGDKEGLWRVIADRAAL